MPSQTVENPEGKTPKVAKYSIVADEVVVANIPKRAPLKGGTSEGLHTVMLSIVEQVASATMILGRRRKQQCFTVKSRMNREVHVRFCERFGGEIPPYLLDSFVFRLLATFFVLLNWWTSNTSVTTINTAVALFWF
jgi:hypothetical protein